MSYTDSILHADIFTYLPGPSKNDTIPFSLLIEPEVVLPVTEKKAFIADWSVVVMLFLLVLIASIRVSSEKYLVHLIQSIFNRQTAIRLFREHVVNLLHPALRLELIFYLTIAMFLYQIELYYLGTSNIPGYFLFLINVAIAFLFINLKYLAYQFTGFIFKVESEVSEYIFYSRSGNKVMGLVLFPLTFLLLFSDGLTEEILLILGILIVLFFSIISLFRGFVIIAQKDFSISYLILYLCSLEILPLLLVWRILWRM